MAVFCPCHIHQQQYYAIFSFHVTYTDTHISVAESGTISKMSIDGRPRQEVEPENFPKPQELIKGSLVFRHTAELKLRPPQKSANPG